MIRAKYYRLNLSRKRQLIITARKFKTAKPNRSKVYKQLVVRLPGRQYKELAIKQQRRPAMRRSRLIPRLATGLVIIVGLVGIGLFGWQALHVDQLDSVRTFSTAANTQTAKAAPKAKSMPRSIPTHIDIPAIDVSADVMQVGLNPDGSLGTPPVLDYITGWYNKSPTPGEIGPSIIDGHVDNYETISVFWRLRELKAGDEIDVARADGSVAKFKVTALQLFDQANFPTKEVYGNINYAGLRLITCGGTFSTVTGHYDHNTVVFAKLI